MVPKVPSLRPPMLAPKALRGVVEHEQALGLGDGGDRRVVGGQAEQIDRDHRLRRKAVAARGGDSRGQLLCVDIEGVGFDVDEDRRGADQRHHFGGGAEGERRADDGVAGTDALGAQRQHQRVGAAGAGDGMLGAAEGGELALEGAHLRAEHELAVVEHARDRGVDGGAETAALGRDVDERDRGRFDTLDS